MRQLAPFVVLGMLACAWIATGAGFVAAAERGWMSESAMRGAFIGKTLDGHYADGLEWTETYDPGGRLAYEERGHEDARAGGGHWYFRGKVFCTFYDPGNGLVGGCFTAFQAGANCYEFYLPGLSDREADQAEPGPAGRWVARAWRRDKPSTCEARPSV